MLFGIRFITRKDTVLYVLTLFEIYLCISNNFCHCIYHIYIYDNTISFYIIQKVKVSQFFLLLSFLQFSFIQKLILKNHMCHFIYFFFKLTSIREIRSLESLVKKEKKKKRSIHCLS